MTKNEFKVKYAKTIAGHVNKCPVELLMTEEYIGVVLNGMGEIEDEGAFLSFVITELAKTKATVIKDNVLTSQILLHISNGMAAKFQRIKNRS